MIFTLHGHHQWLDKLDEFYFVIVATIHLKSFLAATISVFLTTFLAIAHILEKLDDLSAASFFDKCSGHQVKFDILLHAANIALSAAALSSSLRSLLSLMVD